MFKKIFSLIVLFFCLSVSPTYSADIDNISPLQRGKIYFFSKDYEKAYVAFHEAFLENPTDLNISFFLGRAAFEKKDFEAAFMAFDRILIMEPTSVRIRLEIARCHMQLGAFEAAKQYFYEVLEANPPEAVKKNIDFFMATIAAAQKRNFISGMFSTGFSVDNNVRSTSFADLLSNGLTVPDPELKENIFTANLILNHIFKFETKNIAWKSSLANMKTLNSEAKDLDIMLNGITTGPLLQTENFIWEVHGSFNNITLAYNAYLQQTGVGTSFSFLPAPALMVTTSAGIEKKKYSLPPTSALKDASNYFITLSPTLTIGKNRISVSMTKERENATHQYFSYDGTKWSIRLDHFYSLGFSVNSSLSYKSKDYEAHDPALINITTIRQDNVYDLSIGFSANIWRSEDKRKNLALQMSNTYTDADSNIVDYAYTKNVTAGTVAFSF